MLRATYKKYTLNFKHPAGTSRGVLYHKDSWFILLWDDTEPDTVGIGECGLLKGLSWDDRPGYENKLREVCDNIIGFQNKTKDSLLDFPSIRFGLEMAMLDLHSQGTKKLFESNFTQGKDSIDINGLIWMGDNSFMRKQIKEKIASGFKCIKLKIGAIDFEEELQLIKNIRSEFSVSDIEIRVDANGAFSSVDALEKLDQLSEYNLHSIEQPIKQGQLEKMKGLCEKTPLPIALDEELIGVFKNKEELLKEISPQYIILKPSLLGGFQASEEWIKLADQNNIGWWITSALESNIGLNAIAQWTYTLGNKMPQGLGTGQLFTNNIISPLQIKNGRLEYLQRIPWNIINLLK